MVRGSLESASVLDTGLVSCVRGPALRPPCREELPQEGPPETPQLLPPHAVPLTPPVR